jgi:hypothetical protein
MNRSAFMLASLVAITPFAVEAPDSLGTSGTLPGETSVRIAGGAGYYAFIARGCEGQQIDHVPVHFGEAAGEISHRFASAPYRIGVRGGWIEDRIGGSSSGILGSSDIDTTRTTGYVNPFVALEARRVSVGVGWVAHDNEFMTTNENASLDENHAINDVSAHLIIGSLDRKYFAIRWMESVPLYSGGGYLTIGVGGGAPDSPLELYGGFSAGGPYDSGGLFFDGSYQLPKNLRVTLAARGGYGGNQAQTGVSLGLMYRMRKPADVVRRPPPDTVSVPD